MQTPCGRTVSAETLVLVLSVTLILLLSVSLVLMLSVLVTAIAGE